MSYTPLKRSLFGDSVQAMPIVLGMVNLTIADYPIAQPINDVSVVMCVADGSIVVSDGTITETIPMSEGMASTIQSDCTVGIVSGTFDFA